jgi:hypothetical protein
MSHCSYVDQFRLGIAAGGLLRLLLSNRAYATCKGGATILTSYVAVNETSINGPIYYTADSIRFWQVSMCRWELLLI